MNFDLHRALGIVPEFAPNLTQAEKDQLTLEFMDSRYPGVDWDKFDYNKQHDVWEIAFELNRRKVFLATETKPEKVFNDKISAGVLPDAGKEYRSKEEALAALQKISETWPSWNNEVIHRDKRNDPLPSIEYHGPVILNSIKIRAEKSWGSLVLLESQILRKEILERRRANEIHNPNLEG